VTTDDQAREVQDELEAALEAVAEHARVGARLSRAAAAEDAARTAVADARAALADQAADVRALETFSPTRIWAVLRGSRDADLDREQAEHQAAEYAAALAESRLQAAHSEVQRAEAELAALGDVAARRDRALAAKEEWLTSTAGPAAAELGAVAGELAEVQSGLVEVREAIVAGEQAAGSLERARRVLGSAGDWATYDTFFGGGMLTDMVKYDRMDEAQGLLRQADQALRHLAVELADVGVTAVVHGLTVDGLTQTFDVWFDNIFTDWSVKSRISDAAQRTTAAADVVHQVRTGLAEQERDLTTRQTDLVSRRERLLTAP